MQVVINVPEKLACDGFERPFTEEEKNVLIKAIGNGTPLSKGHGRLIDADAYKKSIADYKVKIEDQYDAGRNQMLEWIIEDINETPTIIEADKAESEEKE